MEFVTPHSFLLPHNKLEECWLKFEPNLRESSDILGLQYSLKLLQNFSEDNFQNTSKENDTWESKITTHENEENVDRSHLYVCETTQPTNFRNVNIVGNITNHIQQTPTNSIHYPDLSSNSKLGQYLANSENLSLCSVLSNNVCLEDTNIFHQYWKHDLYVYIQNLATYPDICKYCDSDRFHYLARQEPTSTNQKCTLLSITYILKFLYQEGIKKHSQVKQYHINSFEEDLCTLKTNLLCCFSHSYKAVNTIISFEKCIQERLSSWKLLRLKNLCDENDNLLKNYKSTGKTIICPSWRVVDLEVPEEQSTNNQAFIIEYTNNMLHANILQSIDDRKEYEQIVKVHKEREKLERLQGRSTSKKFNGYRFKQVNHFERGNYEEMKQFWKEYYLPEKNTKKVSENSGLITNTSSIHELDVKRTKSTDFIPRKKRKMDIDDCNVLNEIRYSFLTAAIEVLKEYGSPLSSEELADIILSRGMVQSKGKTPHQTIAARCYTYIKKMKGASEIMKVRPGVFAFRSRNTRTNSLVHH